MKVMAVVSYDGSKFYGFQRQNNVRSVQKELEDTLSRILSEEILVKGAGRTDRGVHAYGQVIHFETSKSIKGLKKKVNKELKDLSIKKISIVDDNFHARHSVKNKEYIYKIDLSGKKNPDYYLILKKNIDVKKMQEASKVFIGTHNFKNFVSGERDNYESTILSIRFIKVFNTLIIQFKGVGFYRYMVRNIVGALLELGKAKIDINVIKDMLNKPEIEKRLATASPNGLYLRRIKY